jgi:steroid 5-alpha reductase family enzyme
MDASMTMIGWNLAAVVMMMISGWLLSLVYKNVTIVDSLWGMGFVLIAWLTGLMSDG